MHRLRKLWMAGAIAGLLSPLGTSAAAQESARPTVSAARRTTPVVIDGRLDDAAWAAASVARDFVQREPIEGRPAQHATEVRILYDDAAIYVGARMFDDAPATIARQLVRRDDEGNADWFAVGFDPRLDRRTGYVFFVSAANVQRDQYVYNDDDTDDAWDAVWSSDVRIDSLGWTVEMRIPLSQLRYQTSAGEQTWGVNFARGRYASNEESHYALMSRLQRGMISHFATLTGIRTEHAPRRIELRPYAVAEALTEPAEAGNPFRDGSSSLTRFGADMRYGLGSAFTLDATINPDFGQVEADPAVINLTAFETFFQERRPFFVEDARIFDFSLSGGQNRLFYGRRIGRRPAGGDDGGADFTEIPESAKILGAAKVTGRTAGGLSLGFITALTDEARGRGYFTATDQTRSFLAEPGAWHSAVRARQDLNDGASTIGAIATLQRRDLPGDGAFDFLPSEAVSAGFDWEHQWASRTYAFYGYVAGSHVRGDSTAMIRIQRSSAHYLQRPDAARLGVDSSATSLSGVDWRMTLEKRRGTHWTGSLWAAEVTPTFEVNDLGFSTRQEVLDGGARVTYREIAPGERLRSYAITAFTFHNWSHDALEAPWSARSWGDAHVSGSVTLNADITLLNYWEIGSRFSWRPELMDRNGTRGGPLMLAPRSWEWSAELKTDERRRVWVEPSVEFSGQSMGGARRAEFGLEIAVRPSPRVEIAVQPQFESVRTGAQFVARTTALPYAPTFGTRYLFAELDRREFGLETRLNVTFSPRMTLQLFAQPLLSSGDFLSYKQLQAPRTFSFDTFEEGTYVPGGAPSCTGGRTCQAADGTRLIDFDGNGTSDFSFTDRDFNVRSLVGNAVFRWEYRPGSALFLVWQRQQEGEVRTGRFDFGRDARALFNAPARNVFLVKASYWVGF
ncbi:MAG: carbohydrate binding family 9 domain-containing protein [Gemmatimonadetes bacterium]|nr:carbohydrate binding family 9 domain-containing protein [Gemmatimonadota bacterium]